MRVISKIQSDIVSQIVEAMTCSSKVILPWDSNARLPCNAVTKKPYRGINVVHLWAVSHNKGFSSGKWGSYMQWQKIGAQVRKGEKGFPVIFFQFHDCDADDECIDKSRRVILRHSTVFNADQVDGYSEEIVVQPNPVSILDNVEGFVLNTNAKIKHGGRMAFYSPLKDEIVMPPMSAFVGTHSSSPTESYYSVLLHELVHWTGHAKRCGRGLSNRFGSSGYAMEELVAELGAAFLCADLGICKSPRQDHADYISSWVSLLEDHHRALFVAASQASMAVDFLGKVSRPLVQEA